MRILYCGVGFNSGGRHKAGVNSKHTTAYNAWRSMLRRCYSAAYQLKQPTYIGCSVHPDWHDFQNFADWFYTQKNCNDKYQLDKDLLKPNNKVYSPDDCCLLPQEINKLIVFRKINKGTYPYGVCFEKESGKYKAQVDVNGKRLNLGRFDCPNKAYYAYKIAKERHVKNKALEWSNRIDSNVFVALMNWTLES